MTDESKCLKCGTPLTRDVRDVGKNVDKQQVDDSSAQLAQKSRDYERVFKSNWDNPRPEVTVESIDSVSANPGPGPFLIAITAEP